MHVPDRRQAVLEVFTDSDYANDTTDRKSISGYVSQIDGNSITYASKKQGIIALSTSEAEYVAMHESARDITWFGALFDELRMPYVKPPTLWCDNQSTVHLSKKPGKHAKFKHVDIKYHYTRDLVERDPLLTQYCSTEVMPPDIFTKQLERVKFERFRDMLRVVKQPAWMNNSKTTSKTQKVVHYMDIEVI